MDFKVIFLLGGLILSLIVLAGTMISLGVIWQKSVMKKTKKLSHDEGRKDIVGLKEDFLAVSKKVPEPSFGLVLAIKVLAICFILIGFYVIVFNIYVQFISRPRISAEYPQLVPDINALYVFIYVLIAILIAWYFILGIGSFRMFRWSRICILWFLYICLFRAIWECSQGWYVLSRGLLPNLKIGFFSASWIISITFTLLLIGFYSHKNVKSAFDSKDRYIRWNDKYPSLLWLINIVIGLIIVFQEWCKW